MARVFINGGSLDTGGVTQRISWGNILTSSTSVTAGFFFKPRANGSSNYDVIWGYGTGRWYFILNGTNGSRTKVAFTYRSGGNEKTSGYISNNMVLNNWYYIIGTIDPAGATTIRVYNAPGGDLFDSASATNVFSIDSTGNSLAAGYDSTRSLTVNARYRKFKVYDRVLSTSEQDNEAVNGGVDRTGLLLETFCNERDGTTARNTASNDYLIRPGTLSGGAFFSPDIPA